MKEALGSSETLILTRATWRNIPEDTILHSHRREDLKSYILIMQFLLVTYNNLLSIFSKAFDLWPNLKSNEFTLI
jgi:hypothetical protein